ncbi:MAG: nucleotidyltransferase domain-containing protein, partial [Candidatus Binataceae bacterium]
MASMQAVVPLVYRYLTSELEDALPPAAADGLRRAFYGNSVRNLHLARELLRLTALLERGGVAPLALKGPALAMAAYGAIVLRQFTDLDLLVRKREAARAVEILGSDGYAPRAGYELADLERPGTYEIAMARAGALTDIDLHWRLIPPYFPLALDSEDLWRRAVRIEIEDAAVLTLAPTDHLLYLCAHGAKHGWQALGGICDLAELIRVCSRHSSSASLPTPSIDWDELSARAERTGAHRALGLGMILAHELLDAPVPAGVLEAAQREPAIARAARAFIGYVRNPGDAGPGFYQRWAVPLGVIAEPAARLRYVAARALLPSADDREFVRLPLMLYPLYYLLRPVRVALKEGPAVWRRLMRSPPSQAGRSSL